MNDVEKARARAMAVAEAEARAKSGQQQESGGIMRGIDDAMRGAADMMTFGFADEIAAKLGDLTGIGGEQGQYDKNLADQRARDEAGGLPRLGGQVAGAIALPGGLAKSAVGAIGQGAALGGLYGFGSGEGGLEERAKDAGVSAMVGGAAGGLLRAGAGALQRRAAAKTIPNASQMREIGESAYKLADQAGVMFTPGASARIQQRVVGELADMGYDPALQPGAAAVLKRLTDLQGQNVTLKGLDTLRKVASNGYVPGNQSNNAMVAKIIDAIDDVVANPANDVVMGNAALGSQMLNRAREAWSKASKADRLSTAVQKADLRAASTGSGGNVDNAIRQNARRLLETQRGWSPAEKQALEAIVRGTPTQNALRLVGKLSPQGSGLMAALGIGGTAANPLLAIAPMGGMAAKAAADKMTSKNVERLSQIIMAGGKSADDLAALARGGQMAIPQVNRIEQMAKMFGVSVPTLSAAVAERIAP